jgi:hypothetical protein
MPEQVGKNEPLSGSGRPFPWFCPKCRRKEVQRVKIPYRCQRLFKVHSVTVALAELTVPRCGSCGELVFDYEAEEQINRAFQARTGAAADEV